MFGWRMLGDIHSRLCEIMQCQDTPFGGMCVVLMGDFVQLTFVGQTKLFRSVKAQVSGQELHDKVGKELLQKFEEVSLIKQHQAKDPHYARSVSSFQEWTPSTVKTHVDFLDTFSEINEEEFSDLSCQQATIVNTNKKTGHAMNEVMLKCSAIAQ